jgi:hypothetical protein
MSTLLKVWTLAAKREAEGGGGAGQTPTRKEAGAVGAQTFCIAGSIGNAYFEDVQMTTKIMRHMGLAMLLVAAIALRAVFFTVSVCHIPASSDESIMGLQAKRIATQFRTPLLMMAQPYMFPLEAYAAAPFIRWLPRTALGVRIVPFGMACAGLAALLALCRRMGPWRETWSVALLVLFAPPYLLILQNGYALPGYPSLLLLCSLAVWLSAGAQAVEPTHRAVWMSAVAGFGAGLACSVNLLAAPVAAMCAPLLASRCTWRRGGANLAAYVIGVAAGLIPHAAARAFFPGAYGAVTQTYTWNEAARRLWEPMLSFTLPAALGGRFPLFPDNKLTVCLLTGADRVVATLWCAALLAATLRAVARNVRSLWRERCLVVDVADVFAGVSWISVALFAFNRRADAHAYRYLVLTAMAFPFVLFGMGRACGRKGFVMTGLAAAVLAVLNAAGGATLIHYWRQPNFARDEASLFDIQPAIQCLDAQGIRFAYASYHVAYRITFATDERIVCSQYYNERFYGWPLPYKEEVDASRHVAFVLTDAFSLRPAQFDQNLARMGVQARRERCGDWTIYSDFAPSQPLEFPRLRGGHLTACADDSPAEAANLADGNPFSRWRARAEQQTGQFVEVRWASPRRVVGVALYYNAWYQDRPRTLNVWAWDGATWQLAAERVERDMDPFEFLNGHPVLGHQVQTIRWPAAIPCSALRIEVAEPESERDWAIGEIEVLAEENAT